MKKTIISIAIASAMVASVASATGYGGGYTPQNTSNFGAIGGAGVTSSATTSTSAVGNNYNGNGYQSSGALATNAVSASASSIPTTAGPGNSVNLTANTATSGHTSTYATGTGDGTSEAMAGQLGAAQANAQGQACDTDYSSNTRYDGNHYSGTYLRSETGARANADMEIGSVSGAASGSISKNVGEGLSEQSSGAGAWNDTSGTVQADADAYTYRDVEASTTTTLDIETDGGSWAYGNDEGRGVAGGIAGQMGGGTGSADSSIDVYQSQGEYRKVRHYNHYHTNYNNTGRSHLDGNTSTDVSAYTAGGSAAGGYGNNNGEMSNVSGASTSARTEQVGDVVGIQGPGAFGLGETTELEVHTGTYGDAIGEGRAIGGTIAGADASGLGYGSLNGYTSVDSSCNGGPCSNNRP